jgi:ribonuclease BN (tRNA processing enzyme)
MRLHVLGSSGTWPAPGRPASGYLVEHRDTRVLLDAGPGVFAALCDRMEPGNLAAVVVSHTHPDHCVDVFSLYHYLAYGPGGPHPVPLFAPAGAADHLAAFVRADEPGHPYFEVLAARTVGDGDEAEVGSLRLRFAEADHSVPTVAVRVDDGARALVYTGDTGPGGRVPELAVGADVLLAEATYQGSAEDKPWARHLTAGEAGELARAAGVGRLILTHLPPTLDPVTSLEEAEATFGRRVAVAVPGMEVTV